MDMSLSTKFLIWQLKMPLGAEKLSAPRGIFSVFSYFFLQLFFGALRKRNLFPNIMGIALFQKGPHAFYVILTAAENVLIDRLILYQK